MKCSELLRILRKDGWFEIGRRGSHIKMVHPVKKGVIIFPDHGRNELGKGTERKILKDAGIKRIG